MNAIEYTDFLTHWGIKGQRWGVRRYQNEDGSLTEEGKRRYYVNSSGDVKKVPSSGRLAREYKKLKRSYEQSDEYKNLDKTKWDLQRKMDEIAKKYGLDADDGGGGNTKKYSRKQLDSASDKWGNLFDKFEKIDKKQYSRRQEWAAEQLVQKYGSYSLGKAQLHGYKVAGATIIGGVLAMAGAVTIASILDSKNH